MPILKRIIAHGRAFLLAAAVVLGTVGVSHAVTYDLVTGTVPVAMPDGRTVTMWGFGLSGGPVTVPGPTLDVPNGESLTINLTNNLPEPVSIVIPGLGLGASPSPVMVGGRVQSFTGAAAAGGGTASYTFTTRPGTHLYESGADPALEIPMGLYGAVRVASATAGQAYDSAATAFNNEVLVLYSEVDHTLNDAVAAGAFGTPAYPSTANFKAQYFLINGKAYSQGSDVPVYVGPTGSNVLLRLINAGSTTRVPAVQGAYMNCIAEDGYLMNFPQRSLSVVLPAGKTKDAIVVLGASGNYPLYDRRLYMTNAGAYPGGALTFLNAGAAPLPLLVAPPEGSQLPRATRPTFSWTAGSAGSSFTVEFSRNLNFTALKPFSAGTATQFTPNGGQWTAIKKLGLGRTLYWRVKETTSTGAIVYSYTARSFVIL